MELFPEEVRTQLPPLYSQEHVEDPMVICKFFHPLSHWTWYAYEGSPVDADGYYDTDKEKVDFLFSAFTRYSFVGKYCVRYTIPSGTSVTRQVLCTLVW